MATPTDQQNQAQNAEQTRKQPVTATPPVPAVQPAVSAPVTPQSSEQMRQAALHLGGQFVTQWGQVSTEAEQAAMPQIRQAQPQQTPAPKPETISASAPAPAVVNVGWQPQPTQAPQTQAAPAVSAPAQPQAAPQQPQTGTGTQEQRQQQYGKLPSETNAAPTNATQEERQKVDLEDAKSASGQKLLQNAQSLIDQNPELAKDRTAYENATGYATKSDAEKRMVDAVWQAKQPKTADALFGILASGESIMNYATAKSAEGVQAATRYASVKPYLGMDANGLYSSMTGGQIVPGSEQYNDLAKAAGWETPAMQEAAKKYSQFVVTEGINRNGDMVLGVTKQGDYSVPEPPSTTQAVSDTILSNIGTDKGMDYAEEFKKSLSADPDVSRLVEKTNETDKQITDLENEKKNIMKDIVDKHPGITTGLLYQIVAEQTDPINRQLDSLYSQQKRDQANLEYKTKIQEQVFQYKVLQDQQELAYRRDIAKEMRGYQFTAQQQAQNQAFQAGQAEAGRQFQRENTQDERAYQQTLYDRTKQEQYQASLGLQSEDPTVRNASLRALISSDFSEASKAGIPITRNAEQVFADVQKYAQDHGISLDQAYQENFKNALVSKPEYQQYQQAQEYQRVKPILEEQRAQAQERRQDAQLEIQRQSLELQKQKAQEGNKSLFTNDGVTYVYDSATNKATPLTEVKNANPSDLSVSEYRSAYQASLPKFLTQSEGDQKRIDAEVKAYMQAGVPVNEAIRKSLGITVKDPKDAATVDSIVNRLQNISVVDDSLVGRNTYKQVADNINSGNYQQATAILDNIGDRAIKKLYGEDAKNITQVQKVGQVTTQLLDLIDAQKNKVGPFAGRVANISQVINSDPKYQELKTLLAMDQAATRKYFAGSAVTDSEMSALKDYIGGKTTDVPENLAAQLVTVANQAATEYNNQREQVGLPRYEDPSQFLDPSARYGAYSGQSPTRTSAPATVSGTAAPTAQPTVNAGQSGQTAPQPEINSLTEDELYKALR